jgi:hypothetical protein
MNWKMALVAALILSSSPVNAAYYLALKSNKCAVLDHKPDGKTATLIGEISSFKSKEAAQQAMMNAPECKP